MIANFNRMPFEKKCKLRIGLSILVLIAGLSIFAFTTTDFYQQINSSNHFVEGFYSGCGGGLVGAGATTLFLNLSYLFNKERMRAAELKETDERNIFITNKTLSITAYLFIFIMAISMMIAGAYSELVLAVLTAVFFGGLLLALIVYAVLNRIY